MSKYTTTLRNIESIIGHDELKKYFTNYNLDDYLTTEQINVITKAGIWNKEKLAEKIIKHYYFREIGFETIALFKHHVQISLEEIMESKLPLIYSKCIEFDPMINIDFSEEFDRIINGEASGNGKGETTSNSTSNSTSNHTTKNLDTAQNAITNLEDDKYLTSANITDDTTELKDETKNNSTSESKQTSKNIEHYKRTQKGNSGSLTTAQNLIEQYRNIIVSIDKDIINELNPLFMGIY